MDIHLVSYLFPKDTSAFISCKYIKILFLVGILFKRAFINNSLIRLKFIRQIKFLGYVRKLI
jgi:hypothetical protein